MKQDHMCHIQSEREEQVQLDDQMENSGRVVKGVYNSADNKQQGSLKTAHTMNAVEHQRGNKNASPEFAEPSLLQFMVDVITFRAPDTKKVGSLCDSEEREERESHASIGSKSDPVGVTVDYLGVSGEQENENLRKGFLSKVKSNDSPEIYTQYETRSPPSTEDLRTKEEGVFDRVAGLPGFSEKWIEQEPDQDNPNAGPLLNSSSATSETPFEKIMDAIAFPEKYFVNDNVRLNEELFKEGESLRYEKYRLESEEKKLKEEEIIFQKVKGRIRDERERIQLQKEKLSNESTLDKVLHAIAFPEKHCGVCNDNVDEAYKLQIEEEKLDSHENDLQSEEARLHTEKEELDTKKEMLKKKVEMTYEKLTLLNENRYGRKNLTSGKDSLEDNYQIQRHPGYEFDILDYIFECRFFSAPPSSAKKCQMELDPVKRIDLEMKTMVFEVQGSDVVPINPRHRSLFSDASSASCPSSNGSASQDWRSVKNEDSNKRKPNLVSQYLPSSGV